MTTRTSHREDNNGSNRGKSAKMERFGVKKKSL